MQLRKQWNINNQEVIKELHFLVGERCITRKNDVLDSLSESLGLPAHKVWEVVKAEHDCHWGDIVYKIIGSKNEKA